MSGFTMKMIAVAGISLAIGSAPALSSAAPAELEPVAANSGSALLDPLATASSSGSTNLANTPAWLLRCLVTGSKMQPGDPMGFPGFC
ncbi:hypothetical protein ACWIGI_32625 [Nocardia sp. NPDC055321]